MNWFDEFEERILPIISGLGFLIAGIIVFIFSIYFFKMMLL